MNYPSTTERHCKSCGNILPKNNMGQLCSLCEWFDELNPKPEPVRDPTPEELFEVASQDIPLEEALKLARKELAKGEKK